MGVVAKGGKVRMRWWVWLVLIGYDLLYCDGS